MKAVLNSHSQRASAWMGKGLTKEAITVDLSERHLRIFQGTVDEIRARNLTLQTVSENEGFLREMRDDIQDIAAELLDGRGVVIVRGWPIDKYSIDEIGILFWAFGKYIGDPVAQNWQGDRLAHVRDLGLPTERGSTTNLAVPMHTDLEAIVGLLAIKKAKAGGVSVISSTRAIYDKIAAERPEYLAPLFAGYRFAWRGAPDEAPIVTEYPVPILSETDGQINGFIVKVSMVNDSLSALQKEALDYFSEVAESHELTFSFTLEPGEASIMCNYSIVHARTSFTDWPEPENRRHFLRLWLSVLDERRPIHPNLRRLFNHDAFRGNKPLRQRT
jgi:hypothetical protein